MNGLVVRTIRLRLRSGSSPTTRVPSCVSDVYDQLGEYEDLDLPNYLAARFDEMEGYEA